MKKALEIWKRSIAGSMLRRIKYKYEMWIHKHNKDRYGYEIIGIIDSLGSDLNMDIWIDWGTLLGFVREHGLIGHDYDIDFITHKMADEQYIEFSNALRDKGFVLFRRFMYKNTVVSDTYDYKGTLVDIDYCFTEEGHYLYYEYDIGKDTKINKSFGGYTYEFLDLFIYHVKVFNTIRASFANGVRCNIPYDAEAHVAYLYGKNWKKPDPHFDFKELGNYELIEASPDITGWRRL